MFDVYPLGDLASLVLRRETRSGLTSLPIGRIDFEDDETTVFIETKLGRVRAGESDELLLRGPLVPRGKGSLAGDAEGFVSTGLRAEVEPGDSGRLRIKRDAELLHHGGFAVAARSRSSSGSSRRSRRTSASRGSSARSGTSTRTSASARSRTG